MTRAAAKLNYSQPTVTKHLQLLEEEVGAPLFERREGRRTLSRAGAVLYDHSKRVLDEMYQLNRDILTLKREGATLRVGGMEQYLCSFFLPNVRWFANRHPDVAVEMHAVTNDEAFAQVQTRELDFGIAVGKHARDLAERVLGYEDLVLFASRKTARDESAFRDCLDRCPVLLDQRATYIRYGFLKQGVKFPLMVHCDSDEAVMEGVLRHGYLGLMGTGRIKEQIDAGEAVVLRTLSSHVPVKLFAHPLALENPLFDYFFAQFAVR